MNAAFRVTSFMTAVLVTVACGDSGDNDNVNHDCQIVQSSGWSDQRLVLHHNDTRSCPALVGFNQPVSAGGVIVQYFPADTGNQVFLSIHHTNALDCQEQSFPDTVVHGQSDFRYALWLTDQGYHWGAGAWAEYTSGEGPDPNRDCAMFRVTLRHNLALPVAVVKVEYTGLDQ